MCERWQGAWFGGVDEGKMRLKKGTRVWGRKREWGKENRDRRKVNRGRLGRKGDSHRYNNIEGRGREADG